MEAKLRQPLVFVPAISGSNSSHSAISFVGKTDISVGSTWNSTNPAPALTFYSVN